MKKRYDVIGVEDLIMDLAFQIDHLPATDGFSRILDYCWQSGGNAASAIVALARLGATCGMIGTAGDDAYGEFCVRDLAYHGVDTSHIKRHPGNTTLCVCLAEESTQGRSCLGLRGTPADMTPQEADESYVAQARAVHLSCIPSSAQQFVLDFARRNNLLVSLDAGAYSPAGAALARQADLLVMSEQFYQGLFGRDENYEKNCLRLANDGGHKAVVVTLGSRGCVGSDGEKAFTLGAFSGHKIVDTTGAGDVFHGGFLYAYLYRYMDPQWGYTLQDCARFASAVSYLNCLTLGGRTGIPTLEMTERFLRDGTVLEGDIPARKQHYRQAVFQ